MEFGIKKCAMHKILSGKSETIGRIDLPNQEIILRHKEEENYKYLRALYADTIKLK